MKKVLAILIVLLFGITNAQIQIGNGTNASYIPFTGFYAYSYGQSIYPKSSIGTAGNITGLTYTVAYATAKLTNTDKIQVWIGHTAKTAFASSSDFIPVSTLTKVFDGTIGISAGTVTINFTTPFAYNNTDNLVIAVNEVAAGSGSSSDKFYSTTAPANSSIQSYSYSGSTAIDPSNISSTFYKTSYALLPNVKLLGISPPAIAPSCTTVVSPANDATNVTFLPKVVYSAAAGATKYFVSVGTTPGGTDITNRYNNGTYLDYFFAEGLDPETTYYVTVFPANSYGEATGCTSSSFTTGKAVANDACNTAEQITALPFAKAVDATYASNNNGESVTCSGQEVANDGVWYALTGDGKTATITVTPTAYWDPMIVVKEGSCDAADCIASVNKTGFQEVEKATFPTTAGTIYYINIGYKGPIDFQEDKFTMNISSETLGTGDYKTEALALYPNPAKDRIYVKNGTSAASLTIYNAAGQIIHSGKNSDSGIDISKLPIGSYILKYQDKDKTELIKFLKK